MVCRVCPAVWGRMTGWGCLAAWAVLAVAAVAGESPNAVDADAKADALLRSGAAGPKGSAGPSKPVGGSGHKIIVGVGGVRLPLVVVRGTPYQMGWHLGRAMQDDMRKMIPSALPKLRQEIGASEQTLVDAWSRTAAFADDRVEQEIVGLADGSGMPLASLQAVHAIALLMPYSCSSIAAWGKATADGHLYQTRNLDWSLDAGIHDFPMIVVYVPDRGVPHVVPSFAGIVGAHTGMNVRGIALAEMGDAPAREAPYNLLAPHFTVFFRTILYDADSLGRTLEIFQSLTHTKRYHYVFGDGRKDRRAVKIRAHAPEPPDRRIRIWRDNDPDDEVAPAVLENVVYNDEGRGAFPLLKRDYGALDGAKMIAIANRIPIRGGNCEIVVYDATALRFWVSYAKGKQEAYLRPYTLIDLTTLDADGDGKPDLNLARP